MARNSCGSWACLVFIVGCSTSDQFGFKSQNNSFWGASSTTVTKTKAGSADVPTSNKLKDPIRTRLAYAAWHEESENYAEARAEYLKVLKKKPKEIEAMLGLARIERALGRNDEADAQLAKTQKSHPKDPRVFLAIGQVHSSRGEFTEAVESMNTAVELAPYENIYKFHLAVAETHAGEIQSAIEHFTRCVGKAEAHYNVGYILNEEGRTDEAERHIIMALKVKPELKQAQTTLAEMRGSHQNDIQPASYSRR